MPVKWNRRGRWYSVSECELFYLCKTGVDDGVVYVAWHKPKTKWVALIYTKDVKEAIAACETEKEKREEKKKQKEKQKGE